MQKINFFLTLAILMAFNLSLNSQIQTSINCKNAQKSNISNSPQTVIQTGTNGWFYFVSPKRNPDIKLRNLNLPNYGGNIISFKAFKGSCNSFIELATDSISPNNDSLLVLNLNDILIGDTIYLFTKKKYSPHKCNVHPSQCNNAAVYQLNFIESENAFTYLSNISLSDLNSTQTDNYNKILSHNIYSEINFISIGDIKSLTPYGKLSMSLPFVSRTPIIFQMRNVEYKDSFDFNWIGNQFILDDSINTHASINLIKKDDLFIGHISVEGKSYEIFDLTGGIQVICETNIKLFVPDECGARTTSITQTTASQGPCADGKSKILFFYTPAAQAAEPNINGRVSLCMSQLNQIWSNSSVSNNLNAVAILPLSFTETGNISNDVVAFSNLPTVNSLRNTYQAEIVVLLTGSNYGSIKGVVKNIGGGISDAFTIVDVISSTTGRFTFAHEISHLFGARHSTDSDPHPSNAHGHIFKTGTGWFGWGGVERRTLMATLMSGSRIEHVSNPSVNFMNVPTGVPFHNNANQINSLKTHVGGFYPDPIPSSFNFTVFKAGCFYGWWCYAEICNGTPYTYNWFMSQNGFTWLPVGTGYVNFATVPWNNALLKCEVRDPSNNLVYSLQKNLVRFGCSGFAYRTSQSDSENEMELIEDNSFTARLKSVPNPNDGSFNVEIFSSLADENASIVLTDITGKIVKEIHKGSIFTGNQIFKIENDLKLPSGIYFIKVAGKGINLVDKIIVE